MTNVGHELLDVPFPEMVKNMGMGIARAQFELDNMGLRLMQMMSGSSFKYENGFDSDGDVVMATAEPVTVEFDGENLSLLELGFTPNFYQFVDTVIEVKMAISTSTETVDSTSSSEKSVEAKAGLGFFSAKMSAKVSMVNASYSNKYNYSAEGSSLLRTKLVPVPPPSILEDRIRARLEARAAAAGGL